MRSVLARSLVDCDCAAVTVGLVTRRVTGAVAADGRDADSWVGHSGAGASMARVVLGAADVVITHMTIGELRLHMHARLTGRLQPAGTLYTVNIAASKSISK